MHTESWGYAGHWAASLRILIDFVNIDVIVSIIFSTHVHENYATLKSKLWRLHNVTWYGNTAANEHIGPIKLMHLRKTAWTKLYCASSIPETKNTKCAWLHCRCTSTHIVINKNSTKNIYTGDAIQSTCSWMHTLTQSQALTHTGLQRHTHNVDTSCSLPIPLGAYWCHMGLRWGK